MAASAGQWELVVKGSKKKNVSVVNGKLSRNEKRQFTENALKINRYGLAAAPTENDGKENMQPKQNVANHTQEHTKKKKNDKKKDVAPKLPRDLNEAIRKITEEDIKNLMEMLTSKFKDSPLIWLKDLASFLNVRLNPSNGKDHSFKNEPSDYPSLLLHPKVKKLFFNTFSTCSDSVLASFHCYCINSMVQEIPKGLAVYGYKLFLQLLAQYKPMICIKHLDDYCELSQVHPNQVPPTLSLLWAVGQAGKKDFNIALKVWLELFFPLIKYKNYASFVIDFGTSMFPDNVVPDKVHSEQQLKVGTFFSIFDVVWSSSSTLSKPLHRQLLNLYPKFKNIAMNSRKDLSQFFPQFLSRLKPDLPVEHTQEILSSLSYCLSNGLNCWSVWNQLYLKHIHQSAILLQYLNKEWRTQDNNTLLTKPEVQETIESILITNNGIEHKVHAVQGLKEAITQTKELSELVNKHKKSSGRLSWSFILLLVLILLIFYDVQVSKGDSLVVKGLDKLGLTIYFESLGKTTRKYIKLLYKWCRLNLPLYYSKGCELAGPYLLLFVEKCNVIVTILYETMMLMFNTIAQYIPGAIKKIDELIPGCSESFHHFASNSLSLLSQYWVILCESLSPVFQQVHNFFMTRVFIGPLEPTVIYGYLVTTYNYVIQSLIRCYSFIIQIVEE